MIALFCVMNFFATESKISAEVIKMMYGNLPTYMYLDEQTGKAQGASVAYFEAVASQMGYKVEWIGPFPQLRFFDYLKNAGNDNMRAITIVKYAQSEAFLEFPDMPYSQTQSILAVRQEDPIQKIRTAKDLRAIELVGWLEIRFLSPSINYRLCQYPESGGVSKI